MAATLAIASCLYLVGERADRIHATTAGRNITTESVGLYRGHTSTYWAMRYRYRTRQLQNTRRTLMARSSVIEAINLACATYGHCNELWRKALCESRYNPYASNGGGPSGLFQFLPSTFASTPYGRFSIWSPYANALAAGWMHSAGRGGEWACR